MKHAIRAACRLALALPPLALLAACNPALKQTPEDREAVADCRQESDRIYAARNRYQLSERDSRDTPYSGNSLPAGPNDGLRDQYERDQYLDDCLAHSAAGDAVVPGTAPAKP